MNFHKRVCEFFRQVDIIMEKGMVGLWCIIVESLITVPIGEIDLIGSQLGVLFI